MNNTDGIRRDMFGRTIRVGDYMVYPATLGRSGTLMVIQVVEFVEPTPDKWAGLRGEPGRMRVRSMVQSYGGPKSRTKLSLLNYPERGMVIPGDALPDACRELVAAVPDSKTAHHGVAEGE